MNVSRKVPTFRALLPSRAFARRSSRTASLQTKLEKASVQTQALMFEDAHKKEDRADPHDETLDAQWMSRCHLGTQHLPRSVIAKAGSVLSRYKPAALRIYGKALIDMYTKISSMEKPRDLTGLRPYLNSEELNASYATYENERDRYEFDLYDELKQINETKVKIEYSEEHAVAYLLRRFTPSFASACRVATEIKFDNRNFAPVTALDFGAGLGSGALALDDTFSSLKHIFSVEPSVNMRKLGKHMTRDCPRILWSDALSSV
eukprot:CAMPEP_0115027006 /NCGR_PEP_ID=MMETSP0216-20121206/35164_1 /TAXON_ID=223996 /ORGANISM="Protocruzia adherens, Strain Boccale" /LENGTH=261 /DNA_ID=CAMNT_0002402349 /DNA_START=77 /DNA_END=859 /DNA_ORIENTATION=+